MREVAGGGGGAVGLDGKNNTMRPGSYACEVGPPSEHDTWHKFHGKVHEVVNGIEVKCHVSCSEEGPTSHA